MHTTTCLPVVSTCLWESYEYENDVVMGLSNVKR